MPVSFYSISTFRKSLDSLCRKEKLGYTSCKKDVCSVFDNLSFDDIWEMHFCIKDSGDIRIIKIRIQNSFQNLSSADGFRLIMCCNRKRQKVVLLNIYPKRGKLAMMDQPKEEYKRQLREYISEEKANILARHNILDELKRIPEVAK